MRNMAVGQAIDRYMSRIVGADAARALDPVYAAQFTYMRRLLETVDMAMEDEGVDEHSRARVIRYATFGAPDEYAAYERMQRHEADLEKLMADNGPRSFPVDLVDGEWRLR